MPKPFEKSYKKKSQIRFDKTMDFMSGIVKKSDKILDIGQTNPFSEQLIEMDYDVTNTKENQDLDLEYDIVKDDNFDVVTAFQIFEHMVSPFPLIKSIKAKKLVVSVPLNLWFSKAYWNPKDPYDRHYHEFEARQFDMLLDKAGWKIIKSEKWVLKVGKIGIRPILRRFTPRHYILYCERK
ncbi:MAG: class I SAM-dependent methyltransferase [Reichenbachiella sp.]